MKIEVTPKFEFTWDWFIALIERILGDIFAFIGVESGWEEEAAE